MPIGYTNTVAGINVRAGLLATQWKQLAYEIAQFSPPVLALGTSGLTALGFSSGDAISMYAAATNMQLLSDLYYGNTTLTSAVNFSAALQPLRGTA